jgi:2-keto-3-deoxy-L-rhamnonate aldolase RhmA
LRINKTKAKLAAGTVALGVCVSSVSPDLIELCGAVGFDFVTIDLEHEGVGYEGVAHMIRAAEAFEITPIVRLPKNVDEILRFLDAGAQGIHVPRCNSASEAQALVDATRFYPQGKRTFYALGRPANYSIDVDDRQWSESANRELLTIAMIEEVQGVENLPEILAVPSLDVIHIGPKDLWQSMGMPDSRVVDQAVAQITTDAVAAGKGVSLILRFTDDMYKRIGGHLSRGARMISVFPFDFVRRGGRSFVEEMHQMAREGAAASQSA